jgi:iron complex outermembrane recepter protein
MPGSIGDVQNVMLDEVDRIEVIRGPGGTIWGSNAVNGVINIITKNAKDTQGTDASVHGGNVDQAGGAVRYGGHRKNFDYRTYAMGFGQSPEFHLDGDNYDDWQMGQAGFRADSNLTDRDTVTFQGDVYKGNVGQADQHCLLLASGPEKRGRDPGCIRRQLPGALAPYVQRYL